MRQGWPAAGCALLGSGGPEGFYTQPDGARCASPASATVTPGRCIALPASVGKSKTACGRCKVLVLLACGDCSLLCQATNTAHLSLWATGTGPAVQSAQQDSLAVQGRLEGSAGCEAHGTWARTSTTSSRGRVAQLGEDGSWYVEACIIRATLTQKRPVGNSRLAPMLDCRRFEAPRSEGEVPLCRPGVRPGC